MKNGHSVAKQWGGRHGVMPLDNEDGKGTSTAIVILDTTTLDEMKNRRQKEREERRETAAASPGFSCTLFDKEADTMHADETYHCVIGDCIKVRPPPRPPPPPSPSPRPPGPHPHPPPPLNPDQRAAISVRAHNDKLAWLWGQVDVLMPELYMPTSWGAGFTRGMLREAERLAVQFNPNIAIVPYTWQRYVVFNPNFNPNPTPTLVNGPLSSSYFLKLFQLEECWRSTRRSCHHTSQVVASLQYAAFLPLHLVGCCQPPVRGVPATTPRRLLPVSSLLNFNHLVARCPPHNTGTAIMTSPFWMLHT
jgi:hypothetical protein